MVFKKQTILKWITTTLWVSIAVGVVVLLVAAIKKNDSKLCSEVVINIHGVNNNFFVDRKDILNTISANAGGKPVGRPIKQFDLIKVEKELETNIWVNKVLLFFDNNGKLQADVTEREPIARVFASNGNTFYIDTALKMLPLSEKYSARLPVFTNYPTGKNVVMKSDSALLKNIADISIALQKDSFLMAMIDQIDITPQQNFEMIPKLGKTVIVFGDGKSILEKFSKLKLFYKQVLVKSGWDYYNIINVNFKNQIVAKRKGIEEVKADSIRAMQIMQIIATNEEKLSADSLQMMIPDNSYNTVDSSLILQSISRDESAIGNSSVLNKPVVVSPKLTPATVTATIKPAAKIVQPIKTTKPVAKKPVQKPVKKQTQTTNSANDY